MQICDILIECLYIKTIDLWFAFSHIVWFLSLHHGGNWKFQGGGGSEALEIPEGRRVGQ